MKTTKKAFTHKLMALAGLGCAVFLSSCKLPPGEVLRGMQREGLVGYFAKSHVENEIVANETAETSQPVTVTDLHSRERSPFAFPGRSELAIPVSGQPGFVYSPHSSKKLVVDVSAFEPGSKVICPYTNKPFIVPSSSTNNIATSIRREKPSSPEPIFPNMDLPRNTVSSGPPVKKTETPESSTPKTEAPKPTDGGSIPVAKRINGRPNYVYSPYASKSQIVDVSGMAPGSKVRCPYTGKLFRVPAAAGSTPAPKPEPKKEAPKPAPKPEPKKEEPKPAPKPEPKKEEPKPAPKPEPKKEEPKPAPKPAPKADDGKKESGSAGGAMPTASWADKDGYVVSPYGNFLVDVRGKPAGGQMRCPFSGKLFKIPSK